MKVTFLKFGGHCISEVTLAVTRWLHCQQIHKQLLYALLWSSAAWENKGRGERKQHEGRGGRENRLDPSMGRVGSGRVGFDYILFFRWAGRVRNRYPKKTKNAIYIVANGPHRTGSLRVRRSYCVVEYV